jgi:hypothetical protein
MATQPAPALRTVAPSVSPEVCAIVDRALAFDPSRRYPTARSMREDIERALATHAAPHAPAPVSIRTDVSSPISVDAPTMAAPAPGQAMQAPMVVPVPPQSAATSPRASSNSPFLIIAVIGSFAVAVCLAAVFLVVRSRDSADDTRENANDETSQEDKASGSSRTMAASSTTSTPSPPSPPSSTAGPPSTRRPASDGKYRLLVKDGKYPFCVTSKLKHAYPVRTNDEGVKVCSGTPDGPIPIDGLKAYHPSELQWQ